MARRFSVPDARHFQYAANRPAGMRQLHCDMYRVLNYLQMFRQQNGALHLHPHMGPDLLPHPAVLLRGRFQRNFLHRLLEQQRLGHAA